MTGRILRHLRLPTAENVSIALLISGTIGTFLMSAVIQSCFALPDLIFYSLYLGYAIFMGVSGAVIGAVATLGALFVRALVFRFSRSRGVEAVVIGITASLLAVATAVTVSIVMWHTVPAPWVLVVAGLGVPALLLWSLASHCLNSLEPARPSEAPGYGRFE